MDPLITRDQHLETFGRFSGRLGVALSKSEPIPNEVLSNALVAECVQCGIQVNGSEILQLSHPVEKEEDTSRVGRLRFAYCARKGCRSYFYKLRFFAHPQLDWPIILQEIDTAPEALSPEEIAQQLLIASTKKAMRRQFFKRVGACVAFVVSMAVLFQWYNGGRIPFIREPEKFKVDVIPAVSHWPSELD